MFLSGGVKSAYLVLMSRSMLSAIEEESIQLFGTKAFLINQLMHRLTDDNFELLFPRGSEEALMSRSAVVLRRLFDISVRLEPK